MEFINTDKILKVIFRKWKKANYSYLPYKKSGFLKSGREEGYYHNAFLYSSMPDYKIGDEKLAKNGLKEINYELWFKPHFEVVLVTYESIFFYYVNVVEAESEAYKFIDKHHIDFFIKD